MIILSSPVASYAGTNEDLRDAVKEGNITRVRTSIDKGADINAKDNDGFTALMFASYSGHTDIVEVLLAKGADVNAESNDGLTALMSASSKGHTDIVEVLLAKGAEDTYVRYEATLKDSLQFDLFGPTGKSTTLAASFTDRGVKQNIYPNPF
ncbi:MAG: ankyrin repeat domain-containing protein [Nitrospirae bacterium]|nr:ankyrin repeat domain-containing protein [Nitrospirota bacterium]